jgi:hypothetical protein
MTKNRARIRAAKALAQTAGIRHPAASYLADNRKLRLPDGSIHDFSKGPLLFHGHAATSALTQMGAIRNQADAKGWLFVRIDGADPTPKPGILDLIREKPSLVVVTTETPAPVSPMAAELAAGAHPYLNVIVVLNSPAGEPGQMSQAEIITGPPGIYRTSRGWAQIEAVDATLDTLGVPRAAQDFATQTSGLFLVTGATGTGKTMTGAALLRRAYYEKGHAAAAIMDPSETVVAEHAGVSVHPIEEWHETAPAIREAVDAGARVIFVDGLRDQKAIEAALDAALGGALVLATMHTRAAEAAQRLLDAFPETAASKIKAKVQLALRGVLEQALVRRADGQGRVLAGEVWTENGGGQGSDLYPVLTLEESLTGLVRQGTADQVAAGTVIARRW